MSSLAGIGNLSSDTLQILQQIQIQNQASETSNTGAQQMPPDGGEPPPELWEQIESSAEAAGLDSEQIESLKSDLKAAVTSAMESASGSGDPESGNAAVEEAVLSTLEEYGIDTEEVETKMSELKSQMQSMGPPPEADSSSSEEDLESELLASITSTTSTSSSDDDSSLLSMLFSLVDEEA